MNAIIFNFVDGMSTTFRELLQHIPPWEKEHTLQTYLEWGYVSSEEDMYYIYLLHLCITMSLYQLV